MSKNITLKIDDEILRACRFKAVEENMSLSAWVAKLLRETITSESSEKAKRYEVAKQKAIKLMQKGYDLGGRPIRREVIHERKSIR